MAIIIKEMRVRATVERIQSSATQPAGDTRKMLSKELARKIRQEVRKEFEKREGR